MWANDLGWDHSLMEYFGRRLSSKDALLVLTSRSRPNRSHNLKRAVGLAGTVGTRVIILANGLGLESDGHATVSLVVADNVQSEVYEVVVMALLHAVRLEIEGRFLGAVAT